MDTDMTSSKRSVESFSWELSSPMSLRMFCRNTTPANNYLTLLTVVSHLVQHKTSECVAPVCVSHPASVVCMHGTRHFTKTYLIRTRTKINAVLVLMETTLKPHN